MCILGNYISRNRVDYVIGDVLLKLIKTLINQKQSTRDLHCLHHVTL